MQPCRLLRPPDPADVQCWHAHERGKCTFLHGHNFLEKRRDQQKAGRQGRDDRIINNELES